MNLKETKKVDSLQCSVMSCTGLEAPKVINGHKGVPHAISSGQSGQLSNQRRGVFPRLAWQPAHYLTYTVLLWATVVLLWVLQKLSHLISAQGILQNEMSTRFLSHMRALQHTQQMETIHWNSPAQTHTVTVKLGFSPIKSCLNLGFSGFNWFWENHLSHYFSLFISAQRKSGTRI